MAQDPHDQFRLAVRSVINLTRTQAEKLYPVLFIDDIDYSERKAQEELLSMILPLLQCRNIVVIYAVRPPSARTVDYHYDNRVKMAFSRARRLYLRPIAVRGHLGTRLAYLLHEPKDEGLLQRTWKHIERQFNPLHGYVSRFIADQKSLDRFPYPFHGRVETFMQRITNGNLNEIVDITLALLSYCHLNRKKLTLNADGTFDLHRKDVVDALTSEDSLYKLFNIHQMKSQKRGRTNEFQNNSTIQNILEMFCFTRYADDAFFDRLCGQVGHEHEQGFGHTREEVRRALDFCLNERLIEEEVFATGGPALFAPQPLEKREVGPFLLTQKGEFYILDLMFWPAYRALFCPETYYPGRSVFGMTAEGEVGRFELERDILEFLVMLINVAPAGAGLLKVGKVPLYDFFFSNYKQAYWHKYESRRIEDGDGYSTLSRNMFEGLVRRRELCSPRKETNRDYFALRPHVIRRCAEDANIPSNLDPDRFSAKEFREFCMSTTSWGEDE